MSRPRTDYDSPWKEVIEQFFPYFMFFFFPHIAADIDWNAGYEFKDKELQKAARGAKTGRHTVDKLVKVKLITGENVWLLIHIEVQSQMENSFAKRIFISNFRLYDHEGLDVISLGVLADNQADWRPDTFGYGRWGSEMRLRYPIVKLLDYGENWAALEQNPNPFAIVVMAHLKTQTTHYRSRDRLRWKVEVVKMLYKRGYTRTDIYNLLRFIDWIMVLSPGLDRTFWQEVETVEEAKPMKYVLSIERIARKDGKREGKKEGKKEGIKEGIKEGSLTLAREITIETLNLRFNSIPEELINAINQLTDLPQLKALHRQAVITGTIEEFEQFIETYKGEQNTSG